MVNQKRYSPICLRQIGIFADNRMPTCANRRDFPGEGMEKVVKSFIVLSTNSNRSYAGSNSIIIWTYHDSKHSNNEPHICRREEKAGGSIESSNGFRNKTPDSHVVCSTVNPEWFTAYSSFPLIWKLKITGKTWLNPNVKVVGCLKNGIICIREERSPTWKWAPPAYLVHT